MREIVLDTETTGLDPIQGHRLVEVACIELVNHVPSGRTFHRYCDPQRDMPEEAFQVHGLSSEFLTGQPLFRDIADDFLEFLGDAIVVAHNGSFDLAFLNAELARARRPTLPQERLVDTLELARKRYPGAAASLDALCRRFAIDLSVREKHGALVDCELLAAVYLELIGGRQPGLVLSNGSGGEAIRDGKPVRRERKEPRPHSPTAAELEAHGAFVATLEDPVWQA